MNNGLLIALGLGGIAAAVIYATSKKEEEKVAVTFDPRVLSATSPGFNSSPLVRYSGAFQPIGWAPPGNNYAAQLTYCWQHVGTPDIARQCVDWMRAHNDPNLGPYIQAGEI